MRSLKMIPTNLSAATLKARVRGAQNHRTPPYHHLSTIDVDTRRRSASDLVRALCVHWEVQITALCNQYIASLFAEYAANPASKWQSKDAALFLVVALVCRMCICLFA